MTDISRVEILEAMDAAIGASRQPPPSDPGATVKEYAEHRGCGKERARKEIQAAVAAGTMLTGKRFVVDAAGRTVPMTVYRAKP